MKTNHLTFKQVQKEIFKRFRAKEYEKVEALSQEALTRFPDKTHKITWRLAVLYLMAGKQKKCLEILEYGQERNIPYPIWPGAGPMKQLESFEKFKKIVETNHRIQKELSANTKAELVVQTPKKYSDQETYPLFITLHGWAGNINTLRKYWKLKKAAREYITAFIQSSQVVEMDSFGWSDYQAGRKDIKQIYQQIMQQYPVDNQQVVIGGFSQGALMAVDIAINHIIPAIGFVALQPGGDLPDTFNEKNVKKAANRGLRGTIITGPMDHYFQQQKEMDTIFQKTNLPHRFIVKRGFKHGFPWNLPRLIDAALSHIKEAKKTSDK
jgi:predicted esterase